MTIRIYMSLYIFLLFSTSYLFANDKIMTILNFLNNPQSHQIFQKHNSCNYGNYNQEKQEDLLQQCAIDLCGKPTHSKTSALLDFNFDQYVDYNKMKTFESLEPLIREIFENQLKNNQDFISAIEEKIKNGENFKQDFSQWEDWEYENLTWKYLDKYINLKIDRSKPFDERLSYELDIPDKANEEFVKGINDYVKSKKKLIEQDFTTAIYEDYYTLDEAKSILKTKFETFNTKYLKQKESNIDFMNSSSTTYTEIKEKVETSKFGDIYALGEVAMKLKNLNNEMIANITGSWPNNSKYSCMSMACKKIIQNEVNKIDIKKILSKLKAKNSNANIKEKLTYCKSQFAMYSIKDYETESFLKLLPEIKSNFMKNVFRDFSLESKTEFEDYLEKDLNISTRFKRENSEEYINSINSHYEAMKSNSDQNNYNNYDFKQIFDKITSYINYENEVDPLGDSNICNDSISYVAWDGFSPKEEADFLNEMVNDADPNKDNLLISTFSCTHHSHGKGIFSHELGHALSYVFASKGLSNESYKKYKNIRKCANTLYKTDIDKSKSSYERIGHDNDYIKTEEDTADLISYLANPDKSVLFSCALLKPSQDGNKYEALSLNNKVKMNTHSSPLLRLLQEAIHKRYNIPNSCIQLINQNKNDFRFKPCF